MNDPRFATGHKVKVRMLVERGVHPGKHPNTRVKGMDGTIKGYGGWDNRGSAFAAGSVNHEYVVGLDDGSIAVISESWLEPA